MLELLKKIIPAQSPSGREAAVASAIEEAAKSMGFTDIARDAMGNLCVHKAGKGERVMLAAHMDSIGLIATYVEENGFVRVGNLGGIRIVPTLYQRVVFNNGVVGVVCADAGVDAKDLTMDHIYIDTMGEKVLPGDTATFLGETTQCGESIVSPYLDDRIGCVILLKLLEQLKDSDVDLFCVFTVQEEVGCRGAGTAAYAIMPDYAIAVDVTGTGDVPGDQKRPVKLGGGPIIKIMDRAAIGHPDVIARMEKAAEKAGIACQRLVATAGGTDTGAIAASRGGVPAACLSVPTRYIHSPNEIVSIADCEQCVSLLKAVLEG